MEENERLRNLCRVNKIYLFWLLRERFIKKISLVCLKCIMTYDTCIGT